MADQQEEVQCPQEETRCPQEEVRCPQEEKWCPQKETRCSLLEVHGVPLLQPIVEHWERVQHFQASPQDVLIVTYPKAGTTWTQEMVDLIRHGGDAAEVRRAPTHLRMPFLEMSSPNPTLAGITQLEQMEPPRVIKTHLPIQLLPTSFWEAGSKVIYVARNPKDNVVSYFHFDRMNLVQPEPGSWPGYLKRFMDGQLGWGSWYEHVKGYWREKDKRNILYIFFEDMKENPAREIRRLASFLGHRLSEDVVHNIVQLTTFEAMQKNPMANYSSVPETIFNRKASDFLRKGEVGDWKNHFSPQESAAFEQRYREAMSGSDLTFRFQI